MVAISQSGLLAQFSSLRLPSGHSGPVLTLSNAACASPPSPRLLVADALLLRWGSYRWAHNLWLLIIYLFFLPVMLPSVVPRLATDLAVRVFPGVWKLLFFKIPFLGWSSVPTSFLSHFVFYIFSYLRSKTMGCFSECLMSSAGIQKLFCGIYSAFKCSFDEFVGEKVVSPSYSSTILGPPHLRFYFLFIFSFQVFLIQLYSVALIMPPKLTFSSFLDALLK